MRSALLNNRIETMNNIPNTISEYFRYKNDHDKAGLLSVFDESIVVFDRGENKEVRGKEQLEKWIETSLSGLNLYTEISRVKEEGDVWTVDTIVSGDFKASPASFIYLVRLEHDKIVMLDIQFAGSLKK